ncbi:hypothetical protein JTB14_007962 [Gonioctena quinquepunctata]|nr:hypothetical protein JTB14_007962 [Gonioctena quinquepunctata]
MRRYVLSIMAYFGFFTSWTLRINLSIALIAMTDEKNVTLENGTILLIRDFDWDSKIQGYILSSFFYGYITTQIIGGYVATMIGGKSVFGYGIGVTALLTLLTPWIAKTNLYLFIAVRVTEGIFDGVTYPCIHALWSKWAPPLERSRLSMLAFSGAPMGVVVSLPICSLLATSFGWESIFYCGGVFGLLWFLCWMAFAAESPEEDSRISRQELKYITDSLSGTYTKKELRIPWSSFATSAPVWAIALASFSETWGSYTLITELPKFIKSELNFDLDTVGFISSLPYLVTAIMLPTAGKLADLFIEKGKLTKTQIRKAFSCSGFIGQSMFIIIPGLWFSTSGTIFCITIAQSLGAFSAAGFNVNHLDIAPQYASILMGISNTFGTIPGICSPIVAGYIVTDEANIYQWRIIFCISSILYIVGAIIYGSFASCELQPWAMDGETKEETKESCRYNFVSGDSR